MNQFRQAWQVHALSSVMKSFATSYPLLNSSIVMILAGTLWGPMLIVTALPAFLITFTLGQFPLPIFGGLVASIGSIPLWLAIHHWLQIKFRDWMMVMGLGLAGGFGAGSWLFQSYYPPMPVWWYGIWTGWHPYLFFLWAAAACILGIAIWIIVRRRVKYSGWIIPALMLTGALLGGWLGIVADETMTGYGYTTNGQGERLMGVGVTGALPGLSILGTLVGVILSLLRVQQAALRSTGKTDPI